LCEVALAQSPRLQRSSLEQQLLTDTDTDRKLLFAREAVLDAARVT
jgi:hypothetical protein